MTALQSKYSGWLIHLTAWAVIFGMPLFVTSPDRPLMTGSEYPVSYTQLRRLEARRHGLPLLHGAADDHAVDRGGDRRVAQIAFDLDDGGLGLFVGVARLLVEVEGLSLIHI